MEKSDNNMFCFGEKTSLGYEVQYEAKQCPITTVSKEDERILEAGYIHAADSNLINFKKMSARHIKPVLFTSVFVKENKFEAIVLKTVSKMFAKTKGMK